MRYTEWMPGSQGAAMVCEECGCVVTDQSAHDGFHRALDLLLQAAEPEGGHSS